MVISHMEVQGRYLKMIEIILINFFLLNVLLGSQPWHDMANKIVEIMKTRTCPHLCWSIFDISPQQLLQQPGYSQLIQKCITWPEIEVRSTVK